jgi:hypothetical protein
LASQERSKSQLGLYDALKGAATPMEAIVRFLIERKKGEKESDEKKE